MTSAVDTGRSLLVAARITKRFAGVQALHDGSIELRAGEVHALVGENGAGKSTLIRIITGAVRPDSGTLLLDGTSIAHQSPRHARERGIVAIYQQPALFPELTVAENIALGYEPPAWWRRVDWKARRSRASDLLERIGARIDPDSVAERLTMPEQQLVEIARALGASARVLILDEPTASLPDADAAHLFDVIRQLRARGVGILYISHRLAELSVLADRVTALRDGATISTHAMADVTRDQLIALMVGRPLASLYAERPTPPGNAPVVLELRDFGCAASAVHDVSLTLRAGEIVGLAGLVGAGRTQLAETIFGLTPADQGEMFVAGQRVRAETPADAVNLGIALVPEDRRHHGVVMEMSVASNVTLASLGRFTRRGMLDGVSEARTSADYAERLALAAPSVFTPVATLSGGNQQKVALSRWLVTGPRLLMLDEPTQGVDVGAKAEIHALIARLARDGMAILLISSDLSELLGMCNRIGVMAGGTILEWFDGKTATQGAIMAAALAAS